MVRMERTIQAGDKKVVYAAEAPSARLALAALKALDPPKLFAPDPWRADAPRNPDGTKVWPSAD